MEIFKRLFGQIFKVIFNNSIYGRSTPYEIHLITNGTIDKDRFNHAVRIARKTSKPVSFYSEVFKKEITVSVEY